MPTNPSLLDKIKDEASLLADSFKHNSPITLLNIPDEERLLASVLSNWSLQKSVAILPAQSTDEELDYYKKTIADYKLFHSDDLKNGNSIPFKIDFHSKKFGLIIFTSGSTGYPKAIFLSLHALTKSTEGTIDFFKMNSNDHFLLSLPLHHIGGFMIFYRALLLNATISKVLNKNLPEAICTLGPTFLSLVPMQLQKMLEDNKVTERLKECRAIILGGAPGTEALFQMIKEYRLPVSLTYGMSETASMVTATSPGDLNSAGRVLKHRDIRIEDGRIVVGGATLFSGHFFEGKYSPHKENEFRTSDLGKISDGELTVIGRADNIFISGGENISPKEIEKEVLALSGIFEAYLIPTPDEIFGTTGTLFYKGDLKNFEITTHLKSRVHPYKMPKRVAKLGDHKNLKTKYQDLQKDAVALSKIKRAFLIHGFMGAPSDFYFLQEELAELQIEIINIELPKKNEFTDSESYLNSILQTVPKDGLTLLFGYSMGGRVALQLLKKAPELFFKVAVISPHPGHYEEVERAQRRERDSHLFDQINDHKSFTQFLFDWYSAPMWGDILDDELFANSLLNKRYNADFKASLDILTLGNQPPLWDFLKETGKDILYISGELDKKYCEIGETLSKENSSIRHVVISEAGHNVHKKKKGDLVALLTHFIFN